jgi:hypothetical protein
VCASSIRLMPTQAAPKLIVWSRSSNQPATTLHDFNRQATSMLDTMLIHFSVQHRYMLHSATARQTGAQDARALCVGIKLSNCHSYTRSSKSTGSLIAKSTDGVVTTATHAPSEPSSEVGFRVCAEDHPSLLRPSNTPKRHRRYRSE